MPPEVGRIDGDHRIVAGSGLYVTVAVGAEVRLRGLIWLQETDLDLAELLGIEHHALPNRTQNNRTNAAMQPAAT
jgi:hypothetical protein